MPSLKAGVKVEANSVAFAFYFSSFCLRKFVSSRHYQVRMKEEYESIKKQTKIVEKALGSPSVCLAKWYHSNIYLQTGETHSCYHPPPHAIDAEKIKKNPSALHNTDEKIAQRREMLEGKRPDGCKYCWTIENLGESFVSDRQIRTDSLYTEQRVKDISKFREFPEVVPDYIEVSFGSECNFKCGYCHPKVSSRYYNEIKEFGPYQNVANHKCEIDWFKIYREEENPYLEAWWKWWEEMGDQLKILRVTGGEPAIQNSTYRLIDSLLAHPRPELALNINSNLGASEAVIGKFCDKVNLLVKSGSVAAFKLYTSMDTWGEQAEYIRTGLNLELFEKNLFKYLETTESPVTFMITFNIFSVPNFDRLLRKILEWRSLFSWKKPGYFHRIRFDIAFLKEPLQFDIQILPKHEFIPYMESHLRFIKENLDDNDKSKFTFMEYEKFRRIVEYMKTDAHSAETVAIGRRDFRHFFAEQDRRRSTNLVATFPELSSFVELCNGY